MLQSYETDIMNSMNISFDDIVDRLKPLDPEKIILFGSYSTRETTGESDIDLCIVRKVLSSDKAAFNLKARKALRDLILSNHIGIDIITISEEDLQDRDDYFYKVDLLQKGKVLYAK